MTECTQVDPIPSHICYIHPPLGGGSAATVENSEMEFHPVVVVVLSQLLTSLYGCPAVGQIEAQQQQQVEDSIFGGGILQP